MSVAVSDPSNTQMDSSARVASSLERLPAEILENIALHTKIHRRRNIHAFFSGDIEAMGFRPRPFAADLTNLRLTCKTIEAKLRHTFERICFRKITLKYNKKALQDLQRVAAHDSFSKAVHALCFMGANGWWEEAPKEENIEEMNKGAPNLYSVLKCFPNVTSINIERYYQDSPDKRLVTSAFSNILAAASLAELPLRSIKMDSPFSYDSESVSFRALLPSESLPFHFSQLEKLALSLDSLDAHPGENSEFIAFLLLAMPCLSDLELAVWNGNGLERQGNLSLDPFLRGKPMGTSLRRCALKGVRLNLTTSDQFLDHHKDHLSSLVLSNCDLKTGEQGQKSCCLTWPLLLQQLESFRVLHHLELKQLGFEGKKIYFMNQVKVTWSPTVQDICDNEGWVYVRMVSSPSRVVVKEYDMRTRLRELQSDFCISDLRWTSDGRIYEWFWPS